MIFLAVWLTVALGLYLLVQRRTAAGQRGDSLWAAVVALAWPLSLPVAIGIAVVAEIVLPPRATDLYD
jgi:hypothetical protein